MSLDNKTITLRCTDCNTLLEKLPGTSIPYCPNCKPQKNHVMNLDGSHAVSVCWCHPMSDSQIQGIQIRFMGAAIEIVKARNSGPNNVIILSRDQAISLAQCILTKFK